MFAQISFLFGKTMCTLFDLLVYLEDVPNVLWCVLAVGHHVVGGVLGRLEHVPLLRQQETVELACQYGSLSEAVLKGNFTKCTGEF